MFGGWLSSASDLHTAGIDGIIFCMKNDLLKEIWRVRDELGAECGYDLKRLSTLVRREEAKVGKRLIHPPKTTRGRKHSAASV